jgi:peptidoglycan hydrolase CwlO-like protein
MSERFKGWVRKQPILAAFVVAVLALVVGGVIGAAAQQSEIDKQKDDVEALQADLDQAESDAKDAQADAVAAEQRADQEAAKNDPLEAQVKKLQEQAQTVTDQAAELDQRQQDLDAREADISGQEQFIEDNTIPNGTWQLGVDYEAGTYTADGGAGCYWEKLKSPSGTLGSIIANGGFGPHQTLVIDSPYFHTADCGDWTVVGQ